MALGFKGLLFLEENLSTGQGSKNVHQGQNIFVLQYNTYLKQIFWLILHNVGFGSEHVPTFFHAEQIIQLFTFFCQSLILSGCAFYTWIACWACRIFGNFPSPNIFEKKHLTLVFMPFASCLSNSPLEMLPCIYPDRIYILFYSPYLTQNFTFWIVFNNFLLYLITSSTLLSCHTGSFSTFSRLFFLVLLS